MRYRHLGDGDLRVSAGCLGAMLFGVQNTATDGHAQLDPAFTCGRRFVGSTIMVASSLVQLEVGLSAPEIELSTELIHKIEQIHLRYANPAP